MIQSDSFVCHSANFYPRIELLLFLNSAEAGMLKTVQNYLSRCHGSRETGEKKVSIKLNETSLFTILNMVFLLHFVINFFNFIHRINMLLFLDSAKAGLLKNVQNQFSRCIESREFSKTKAGTFF